MHVSNPRLGWTRSLILQLETQYPMLILHYRMYRMVHYSHTADTSYRTISNDYNTPYFNNCKVERDVSIGVRNGYSK